MQVQPGNIVTMHYTGRFEDGTVFDTSEGRQPLEFVAGSPEMIQGVRDAVLGMEQGETRTVTVPPEEGYGERQENAKYRVPRPNLPPDVKVGDQLAADVDGQRMSFWVVDLNNETGMLDANHPLAGRTLIFDIEVVEVREP